MLGNTSAECSKISKLTRSHFGRLLLSRAHFFLPSTHDVSCRQTCTTCPFFFCKLSFVLLFRPPPQHVLNTSSLPCKRSQYVVDDDDDDDDDDEMMTVLREFYRLDLTMLTKIRLTDDNDD